MSIQKALWLKYTDTLTVSCITFHHVSTVYRSKTRAEMSSQPSSTWAVNMSWGMSDRSSEVRKKHALAGTEGHSHLVIWVNYKWGRPRGGKMSRTAVSPDTHINTHTQDHSPYARSAPLSTRSQGPVVAEKPSTAARWNWGKVHNHSRQTPFHSLSLRLCFSLRASHGNTRWSMFLGFVYCNYLVFSWLSW